MEFLIDTGMELARHIITKIFDAVSEKASETVAGRAARNAQKVRDVLEPQLNKIEAEIKDLAEGTYKTALSHIHHALVILKERSAALDMPHNFDNNVGDSVYFGVRKEGLPETAVQLIHMAYDKAYNSFNYSGNLPPQKRITAMQVAILCIGLQHVNEPRIILARWEKCVRDAFADDAIAKAIQKNLDGSSGFKRFVSGSKPQDLVAFLNFARDLLTQSARIAARDEVERGVVDSLMDQISHPPELDKGTRILWAEKLNWRDYANYIKWRDELKPKQAGAPFDACAALPDGGVVIAMGNDALIQYNRDLERINFKPGAYYSLAYDPRREWLWGFSKRKNTLVALDLAGLEPIGLEIDAPEIPPETRIVRWHTSVTSSGWIVIAGQYLRSSDTESKEPLIFAKHSLEDIGWQQLFLYPDMKGGKVTDIAARDLEPGKSKSKSNVLIALALEGQLYIIHASLTVDECRIHQGDVLLPDVFRDIMSCVFDDQGHLVVVVRRQTMNIVDAEQNLLLKNTFATRASGMWIAAGQRAIWTPTLTGDICQYEYFLY